MKKNPTKRTLIMSALSLLLCCAMLIGSTAAWFTDTATSTGNKIQAGTLDIDLVMDKAGDGNYTSIADDNAPIFGADRGLAQNDPTDTLWEPGKTQIAYLGVQNKGNLALKYNIILDVADNGLASALEYAIIPGAKAADLTAAAKWDDIKTAAGTDNIGTVAAGRITAAQNGVLDEIVNGTKNETQYFALAVHMKEEAGNEYQGKNVTIDVNIVAAQYNVEADTFGSDYDKDVEFDEVEEPALVDNNPYLTFSSDGEFKVSASKNWPGTMEYATAEPDKEASWKTWDGTAVTSGTDNKVYIRGKGQTTLWTLPEKTIEGDVGGNTTFAFAPTTQGGLIDCTGSAMTLLDYEHPDTVTMSVNAFACLFFGCDNLRTAPNLPSMNLFNGCYSGMFMYCSSLTAAPTLPATTLADNCYNNMFYYCTSLEKTPALPAETLTEYCYWLMFNGCTNLTDVGVISAKTFGKDSCDSMFNGCSKLAVVKCEDGETGFVTTPAENTNSAVNYMFAGTKYVNVDGISEDGTPDLSKSYKIEKSFAFLNFYDGESGNATINGMDATAFCQYMVDNKMITDASQFGSVLVKSKYYSKVQSGFISDSKALSLLFDTTYQEQGSVTNDTLVGDSDYTSDKTLRAFYNGTFLWDGSSFVIKSQL